MDLNIGVDVPGYNLPFVKFIEVDRNHDRISVLVWLLSKMAYFGQNFAVPELYSDTGKENHNKLLLVFLIAFKKMKVPGYTFKGVLPSYPLYKEALMHWMEIQGALEIGHKPFGRYGTRVVFKEEVGNWLFSAVAVLGITDLSFIQQLLSELLSEVENVSAPN